MSQGQSQSPGLSMIAAMVLGLALMAAALMGLLGSGPVRQADSAAFRLEVAQQSAPPGWFRLAAQPVNVRRFEANRAWLSSLAAVEPEQRRAWLDAGLADLAGQLAQRPADGHAWMIWAWLKHLRGEFGPAVFNALRLSYAHGRFELLISMDRVYLTLAMLPLLPDDLRREALLEVRLMGDHRLNTRFLRRLADAAVAAGPDAARLAIEQADLNNALSGGLMTNLIAEAARQRGVAP